MDYAEKHNVPITATEKSIYSRDRNLWHMSHEGGFWKIPGTNPKKSMFHVHDRTGRRAQRARIRQNRFPGRHSCACQWRAKGQSA